MFEEKEVCRDHKSGKVKNTLEKADEGVCVPSHFEDWRL